MVTKRLAKHRHREQRTIHLSLGGREGGRASPWSSEFEGLIHTHKHTQSAHMSSWNWPPLTVEEDERKRVVCW